MGTAATFPAVRAFEEHLSAFFPVFVLAKNTIVLGLAAAVLVAVVAAVVPLRRAVGIRIADGLRRIG